MCGQKSRFWQTSSLRLISSSQKVPFSYFNRHFFLICLDTTFAISWPQSHCWFIVILRSSNITRSSSTSVIFKIMSSLVVPEILVIRPEVNGCVVCAITFRPLSITLVLNVIEIVLRGIPLFLHTDGASQLHLSTKCHKHCPKILCQLSN